jgi:phosphocarrier protein HPr
MSNDPIKIIRDFEIRNTLGLHARPASQLVQLSSTFASEILIEKDGDLVNGKSLMGLLMLAAGYGSTIRVIVSGHDAESAISALHELIAVRKFDED